MCNEYKLRIVDGRWVWIHVRGKGRGLTVQDDQGEFTFDTTPPDSAPAAALDVHVFPDRVAPVIRRAAAGAYEAVEMRWGFPPVRAGGALITNVRNLESPYWRPWLAPRWRCLVPVSEFCEWTDEKPARRRWFRLREAEAFCFAGVWRHWTGARGARHNPEIGEHLVFAFVTTAANEIVRPVHAQAMPLILPRERWDDWLDGPVDAVLAMQMAGFPAARMAQPGETMLPD